MRSLKYLYFVFARIGVIFALYTICRILFFAFNYSYFSDQDLLELLLVFPKGFIFDAPPIIFTNALFILFLLFPSQLRENKLLLKVNDVIFYFLNSIALLANCIDFAYYPFTLKRTTFDLFRTPGDITQVIVAYLSDYWYIVLILLFLIWLMYIFTSKVNHHFLPQLNHLKLTLLHQIYVLVLSSGLAIIGFRGGWQLKPIHLMDAGRYVNEKNIALLLNTPFSIMRTADQLQLEPKAYYSEEEALLQINPVQTVNAGIVQENRKNVVLIILESIGKEHLGFFCAEKRFTPFLDSLCGKSIVMADAFANAKTSKDGIPAIIAGIPSLHDDSYIHSAYSTNKIDALPIILKSFGYHSSFYHGGSNGTMGFDIFCKNIGFDEYNGRNEYNNEKDYDGHWGIYDEPYLQYFANELNQKKQPFFSCVFTLSSHHPYSVPDKYVAVLPSGKKKIQKSIAYTDLALRNFFAKAKTMPWYKNTLFVLCADHTSEAGEKKYKNNLGVFSIPIIFYSPSDSIAQLDSTISQQIDILPNIIQALRLPTSYFAFGTSSSIFSKTPTSKNKYAVNYLNRMYQCISTKYLLIFDGIKTKAFYERSNLKLNLIGSNIAEMIDMENYCKAFVQVYNNSLIQNRTSLSTLNRKP